MRWPNPWVAIPVALGAIGGGVIGYLVMEASCSPGSCVIGAGAVALVAALGSALGVGVVVVLALKSFTEARDYADREVLVVEDEEPGPPRC